MRGELFAILSINNYNLYKCYIYNIYTRHHVDLYILFNYIDYNFKIDTVLSNIVKFSSPFVFFLSEIPVG